MTLLMPCGAAAIEGNFFPEFVHKVRQLRPGPHEAHLPFQNVEKFGKLVETRPTEEISEPRQPLRVGKKISVFAARLGHRPQLEHPKDLPSPAGTLLAEEDRFSQKETHSQRQNRERNRQNGQEGQGDEDIGEPFSERAIDHERFPPPRARSREKRSTIRRYPISNAISPS